MVDDNTNQDNDADTPMLDQSTPNAASKPYILMAEDAKFFSKLNRAKFLQAGFEVTAVENGQQLLDAARQRKPDIILLDLIMPKKDGFATIEELKADPKLKDIKVLVFSDLGQPVDIEKLTALGAADFLIKDDTSPDALVNKVREHLSTSA